MTAGFPQHIYCIGIGGIGLSALAQLLQHEGHAVSGSDRSESPVTELLKMKGINVLIGQDAANIPENTGLVIYSGAVHADNPERVAVAVRGLPSMTYFEALGPVSRGKRTVAISGTHGKTTTTAMVTKMLVDMGKSPTAIIGSLTKDFGSNFVPGTSDIFVVEACEYKRHFLHIEPEVLVITNIELDHTDYYKDIADIASAFKEMAGKVRHGGSIVSNPSAAVVSDALSGNAHHVIDYTKEKAPELSLIGEFNRANARAAKAAVKALVPDADEEAMDRSLQSFHGTWRRFEAKGATPEGALVYDDYAHHPTAVVETIRAAKQKFPGKLITVIFQPHLYSRTKSLLHEFALSLSEASDVVLLPIYAAREANDPEVSSEKLAAEIVKVQPGLEVKVFSDAGLAERYLRQVCKDDTIIITMGASDIYMLAEALVRES